MGAPDHLLTIDCGNSTIDLRRVDDGARLVLARDSLGSSDLAAFLAVPPRRAMLASVVPEAADSITSRLAALGCRTLVAGRDVPCPLPLRYDTPATLGVDRWLGALAAHRRAGRAVVVDCGTATTVNLVESDGSFCGGSIAPGLAAFVAGMVAATPRLPTARLDAEPTVPARTSQAAVDAGVLLGYCGLVEHLVALHQRAARGPSHVFATGGNASRLLRWSRLQAEHAPALVHEGLELLAADAPWSC